MLLTSSQVSLAISFGIISLSTFALFLAGYVLQLQTLHSIQTVIKPHVPSPRTPSQHIGSTHSHTRWSNSFLNRQRSKSALRARQAAVDWTKLAYVQVVQSQDELCDAIMLFGDLVRLKSPAQKVLLVPKSWLLQDAGGDADSKTIIDMLRKAARKYRVRLMSTGPDVTPYKLSRDDPSLQGVFAMREYRSVILLRGPASVLNAEPMDAILAFVESKAPITSLVEDEDAETSQFPLLIKPLETANEAGSAMSQQRSRTALDIPADTNGSRSIPKLDTLDYFQGVDKQYLSFISSTTEALTLHLPEIEQQMQRGGVITQPFNATKFKREAAFMRFSDRSLPGPEYDVPYEVRAIARPRHDGARRIWERAYESYRARRHDICGLDLKSWEPASLRSGVAGGPS